MRTYAMLMKSTQREKDGQQTARLDTKVGATVWSPFPHRGQTIFETAERALLMAADRNWLVVTNWEEAERIEEWLQKLEAVEAANTGQLAEVAG